MSRKDYIAIAKIIESAKAAPATGASGTWASGCDSAREVIASNLATLFAKENDRFDRDRFLAACGVQS